MGAYNLGGCYRYGHGVAKDRAKAIEIYKRASELGSNDAKLSLAWMYEHGQGVKKDLAEAVKWYKAALEGGEEGVEYYLSKKKFANYVK